MEDIIYIKDLRIKTIIGIFDWERKVKQEVSIDMEFPFDCKKAAKTDSIEDTTDYKAITKAVIKFVEESSFQLQETLAENIAELVKRDFDVKSIKLRVSKPGALAFAIEELNKILSNVIISSTHKTKAEGFEGDDFLNLVLAGDSKLDFDSLNEELKTIEDSSGRKRDVPKFSARTLDIDIVLQIDGDEIVFESDEINKYLFVSEPLKELI